jgi:hypothetical protein
MTGRTLLLMLLLATGPALAGDEPAEQAGPLTEKEAKAADEEKDSDREKAGETKQAGPKVVSGMSILGNQEAPKSLVIVPWKDSVLGASIGFAPLLDDARQPVDKEVFMRALTYYEIRSEDGD